MDITEFYTACQLGDISPVKWLLPNFSLDSVNKVEGNGSSALRAAAPNGHSEIILLLLEKGASRRQLDIFGDTPIDVAKTAAIQHLFQSLPNEAADRFVTHTLATEMSLRGSPFPRAKHFNFECFEF